MPYLNSQPALPWSGRTVTTRHTSHLAAVAAQAGRSAKQRQYLDWLAKVGRATDHGAEEGLGWPLSSVCSVRNGCKDQIRVVGLAEGRYGRRVAVFAVAE